MKKRNKKPNFSQKSINNCSRILPIRNERSLNAQKKRLEKDYYFPAVVESLKNALTPLAVKNSLSKDAAEFYLIVTSHKLMNKNFGGGMLAVWSNIF